MLTADEARKLMPATKPASAILADIENAIRRAAQQGRTTMVEITSLVPQPHSGAWCVGRHNELTEELERTLQAAGYEVDTYSGGHQGRGYIRVKWGQ